MEFKRITLIPRTKLDPDELVLSEDTLQTLRGVQLAIGAGLGFIPTFEQVILTLIKNGLPEKTTEKPTANEDISQGAYEDMRAYCKAGKKIEAIKYCRSRTRWTTLREAKDYIEREFSKELEEGGWPPHATATTFNP